MKVSLIERSMGYQDENGYVNEILVDRKGGGALRTKKDHYYSIPFVPLILILKYFSQILVTE